MTGTWALRHRRTRGIDRSTGKYALLLNSDTILIEGEITKMLAFMEEHEDVGICGPQLVYPDMRPQRSSASIPSLPTEVLPFLAPRTSASGIDNRSSIIDHRMSGGSPDASRLTPHEDSRSPLSALSSQPSVRDVPSIIGAAMMIRKSLFKALSGFDEQFFFFLEETDLCLRTTRQSAVSRQQTAISDQQAVSIIDNRSSIIDETSSPPPDSPDQHPVSSIQYRVSSDQHPASSIQHQVSIIGNRQSAIDETSSSPRDADGSSNVEPPIESFEGRHGTLNVEPSSHPSALRSPPEVSPRTPHASRLTVSNRVVLLPDVRVIHLQGKTVGKNWIKGRVEYNISLYKFIKKHHSPLYYRTFQAVRFLKSSIVILALSLLPFLLVSKSTRRRYIYYWKILLWHLTACPPTAGLRPPA